MGEGPLLRCSPTPMLQTELRVGEAAALSIAKTAPQRADLSQKPAAPRPAVPHISPAASIHDPPRQPSRSLIQVPLSCRVGGIRRDERSHPMTGRLPPLIKPGRRFSRTRLSEIPFFSSSLGFISCRQAVESVVLEEFVGVTGEVSRCVPCFRHSHRRSRLVVQPHIFRRYGDGVPSGSSHPSRASLGWFHRQWALSLPVLVRRSRLSRGP